MPTRLAASPGVGTPYIPGWAWSGPCKARVGAVFGWPCFRSDSLSPCRRPARRPEVGVRGQGRVTGSRPGHGLVRKVGSGHCGKLVSSTEYYEIHTYSYIKYMIT